MDLKSSRKEAMSANEPFYFTGKPCIRGHISNRRTSTGTCLSCLPLLSKRYKRDSEHRKEYMRDYLSRYQKENREAASERKRNWAANNSEYERVRARLKRNNNREYYYQKCAERRAKKAMAIPAWFDRKMVSKVYAMASKYGLEVDHIVPITSEIVCGLHTWDNLQLLSRSENAKKMNTSWPDMPGEK